MKKYLILALIAGFTFVTFVAYQKARPIPKAPIYTKIVAHSPYYREKRFGGFQIRSRIDEEFKEKPTNMEIFHRMEQLHQDWAKTHIKLVDNQIIISDNNGTELEKLPLLTQEDSKFIHDFFGL
jgi:hypothetical protein